eukprot:SAG11_NODE_1010_length_6199_cov_2.572131_2_plen_73_part_00
MVYNFIGVYHRSERRFSAVSVYNGYIRTYGNPYNLIYSRGYHRRVSTAGERSVQAGGQIMVVLMHQYAACAL